MKKVLKWIKEILIFAVLFYFMIGLGGWGTYNIFIRPNRIEFDIYPFNILDPFAENLEEWTDSFRPEFRWLMITLAIPCIIVVFIVAVIFFMVVPFIPALFFFYLIVKRIDKIKSGDDTK